METPTQQSQQQVPEPQQPMQQGQSTQGAAPQQGGGQDIAENKVIAAIGYIWVLFLVPLLGKKESKFAQFHAKQGLVLFIASIILMVIGWIPILGWLIFFVGGISILIFSIMGIIKALQGEYWEMPLVGQYAKKINL